MLYVEIFIAGFLETRIVVGVVTIARVLQGLVKVDNVLAHRVEGSKVRPAAKPSGVSLLEIAEICMNRRNMWTQRMENEGDSGRKEDASFARFNPGRECLGQLAVNRREVDTRLLEDSSVLENACETTASSLSLPPVQAKPLSSVDIFEGLANTFLEAGKEFFRSLLHRQSKDLLTILDFRF